MKIGNPHHPNGGCRPRTAAVRGGGTETLPTGEVMATTTVTGTSVTYSNSSTAAADIYGTSFTQLTEDSLGGVLTLDVMANDGGGAKTILYSLDDGIAQNGTL